MATKRDFPYSQFNFRVSWDGLDEDTVEAGFQEISGLGLEINVAEYRAGNHSENAPLKVNCTNKVPDVTLKRGVIGVTDFYSWIDEVREGSEDYHAPSYVKRGSGSSGPTTVRSTLRSAWLDPNTLPTTSL